MSDIKRRLRALESKANSGDEGKCPECGGEPRPDEPVEYEIVWEPAPTEEEIQELREWYEAGMPEEESPASPEPEDEYCERCGRQTLVVIDWPDAPTHEERRRLSAQMLAARDWDVTFLGLEEE